MLCTLTVNSKNNILKIIQHVYHRIRSLRTADLTVNKFQGWAMLIEKQTGAVCDARNDKLFTEAGHIKKVHYLTLFSAISSFNLSTCISLSDGPVKTLPSQS